MRTTIDYPYYKGSPCVTMEIITEKFDFPGHLTACGSGYDFPGVDHEGRQTFRLSFSFFDYPNKWLFSIHNWSQLVLIIGALLTALR